MTDTALATITSQLSGATRPCVTSSFQAECVVLIHMIRVTQPDIPVLFVDTVHHFPETYRYRDHLVREWNLNLVTARPADPRFGLWEESTDACCAHNKVSPLFRALEAFDTWFTALRREQSASRARVAEVASFQLPSGKVLSKVSPLAAWTMRDVESYARMHSIPLLPLYDQGYISIGCAPCTRRPSDPLNPRSGRWQGQKLECGIHIEPKHK